MHACLYLRLFFVCLSVSPSVRRFVCLSVCLSVVCLCPSVHLSVRPSVCPSVCLSICLSACLFVSGGRSAASVCPVLSCPVLSASEHALCMHILWMDIEAVVCLYFPLSLILWPFWVNTTVSFWVSHPQFAGQGCSLQASLVDICTNYPEPLCTAADGRSTLRANEPRPESLQSPSSEPPEIRSDVKSCM